MGFFRKELLYVIVLMCGSSFVGQSLAYYSPAGPAMIVDLKWSESEGTWFSTLSSLTAILGGPITNLLVPKLGRKTPAFIFSFIAIVTWILIFVTKADFMALAYVARAIQGICVGGLSSICSMYIVEISPPENKGSYGTLHQLGVTLGMAYCYLIGIWCSWRVTTILCALFALLLAIFIWFIPESPVAQNTHKAAIKESLWQMKFLPSIVASVLLMFFQQFSGINALGTNLQSIFTKANVPIKPAVASLLVGLSQCITTAAVSPVVGKFGRRIPFVISAFGQGFALLLTWASDVWDIGAITPVIAIFLDFFFFGIGFGPIPWFIVPELFPDSVRQFAVSLSTGLNWLLVSIIVLTWPPMEKSMTLGWGMFFFAIICIIGGIYGIKWMPEKNPMVTDELDDPDANDEQYPNEDHDVNNEAHPPEL